MQKTAEGIVSEIIFTNEDNGYTVCAIDSGDDEFVAVGIMPALAAGESVRLYGDYVTHPDYGHQFKVASYEHIVPKSQTQIQMYLSMGVIKGVGPSTAAKIVQQFGDKALDVMRDEPHKLTVIKGISHRKAMEMSESLISKQVMQNLVMFLQPYGVTAAFALKIFKKFGPDSDKKIKNNPYILCEVDGIGFLTADKLAEKLGVDKSDENRLKQGVLYVLREFSQNGNTFIESDRLTELSKKILMCDEVSVENAIFTLKTKGEIVTETVDGNVRYYLPLYYNAEVGVARKLCDLVDRKPREHFKDFGDIVRMIEIKTDMLLSKEQRDACFSACSSNVFIITGGPGTGKTTIINTIISIFEREGKRTALCAPTGRAAKRMSETCGIEAKTIHRLLEINFHDGENQSFIRDERYPVEEDVIIVDEMSMVDILLMNSLLRAMKPGASLIMVGDFDQLPSVGAGNVLCDMINSGKIPFARLTQIYRQASESLIVLNAHRINKGELPVLNEKDKDFFFLEKDDADDILKTVSELYTKRLPKAYDYDVLSDIQVISPSRKTKLGVLELNRKLQADINPPADNKNEKVFGDFTFREGDKVMQIKNDYDIQWKNLADGKEGMGVFNGDIGRIKTINTYEKTVSIVFDDDRRVIYDFNQLEEIEPAYAVTVHKSQGSEFPAVIIPMYPLAPQLMNRNLLYTALTRAKNLVVFVGRKECMFKMIQNTNVSKRNSGLREKLERLI